MKSYKDYLAESFMKHKYPFKIKIAGEKGANAESLLKELLDRYGVDSVKKTTSTPIQSFPLDFPKLRNTNVTVYDTVLNYPTTPNELVEFISAGLGVTLQELVVRNPNEPTENEQNSQYEYDGSLLEDPDYKEHNNAKHDDFYGTKYNLNMLKELNKAAKARDKERGVKIPKGPSGNAPVYEGPKDGKTGPINGKAAQKVTVKSAAGSAVNK